MNNLFKMSKPQNMDKTRVRAHTLHPVQLVYPLGDIISLLP